MAERVPGHDRDFESLYRGHHDAVYRAALRELRNVHDAEDVTQAAFVDAYRALLRGSRPEAPRAWLLAIAENVRRRRFRTALKRPREVPLEDAGAAATPEEPEAERAGVSQLKTALAGLPRPQLEAFVLREISGLSYDEISSRTGASVASVQMSLFRARQTLRAALERPTPTRRARRLLPVPAWLPHLLARAEAVAPGARGLAAAAGAVVLAVGAATATADADPRREPPARAPQPASSQPPARAEVAVVPAAAAPAATRPAAVPAPAPVPRADERRAQVPSAPAPQPAPAAPTQAHAAPVAPPAPAAAPRPLAPVTEVAEATEEVVERVETGLEQVLEDARGATGAAGGQSPSLPPLPLETPPPVPSPALPPAP